MILTRGILFFYKKRDLSHCGVASFLYLRHTFINAQSMNKVISIESVRRGNAAIMSGKRQGISMDANNVSVRCKTAMGNYTMTFNRKKIVRAANEAFAKIMR